LDQIITRRATPCLSSNGFMALRRSVRQHLRKPVGPLVSAISAVADIRMTSPTVGDSGVTSAALVAIK
jgi:uncharacterized protein (UPF0218 family)